MHDITKKSMFKIVVSNMKICEAGSSEVPSVSEECMYYYAEKNDTVDVHCQQINANSIPTGDKFVVSAEEFFNQYKPEPLIYFNKVLPAVEALEGKISKAEVHLKNNRFDKAEARFKEALLVDPDNIRAVFGLGVTYISAGKTENADEIFSKIMSLNLAFLPEHISMFNEFGIKLRKAGMLDQALEYYMRAIRLNDQDENLYFNLARVYYAMNDSALTEKCLDRALLIAPEFKEAEQMKSFIASGVVAPRSVPEVQPA